MLDRRGYALCPLSTQVRNSVALLANRTPVAAAAIFKIEATWEKPPRLLSSHFAFSIGAYSEALANANVWSSLTCAHRASTIFASALPTGFPIPSEQRALKSRK